MGADETAVENVSLRLRDANGDEQTVSETLWMPIAKDACMSRLLAEISNSWIPLAVELLFATAGNLAVRYNRLCSLSEQQSSFG
jgi:hypothetical protein